MVQPPMLCDNRSGSLVVSFTVVNRLRNSHPHIDEAQSTDHTANKIERCEGAQAEIAKQQTVVGPHVGPGKHHQDQAHPHADHHKQHQRQPPHPQLTTAQRAFGYARAETSARNGILRCPAEAGTPDFQASAFINCIIEMQLRLLPVAGSSVLRPNTRGWTWVGSTWFFWREHRRRLIDGFYALSALMR